MSGRYANEKKGAARERRLRRGWRQVISILSLLVVFATISSLTLPAITLDYAGCGLEEHIHAEACYTPSEESRLACPVELHVHTEACKDAAGALICGKADYAVHTHDEMCSDAAGNVVCALNERKAHAHTDACYEIRQTEVTEAHAHTDDCYEMTKDTEPTCGQTHGHTGNCYAMVRGALLCGKEESEAVYEDEKVLVCTEEECTVHVHDENCGEYCTILEVAAHQHTEECFETGWLVLTCEKPEHTHGTACYSDPEADVETPEDWEKTLPAAEELTAAWAENVVMVARSQLGYEESTKNYLVSEDQSIQGYTRYGAWYGNKYAEWCAMFLAFCMNYAGVPEEAVPHHAGVESLKNSFEELETYFAAEDYTPVPGDIVFYDRDGDGRPNHVGLVAALEEIPVEPESTEESTDESTDESSEESTEALLPEEEKIENTELTKPGAEAEEPTEESSEEATEETSESSEEATESAEEPSESTEESTEVTEESTEESTEPETIWLLTAIEGNCDKAVKEVTYDLTDETILGYMSLAAAEQAYRLNNDQLSTELTHTLTAEGEDYTVCVRYSDAARIPESSLLMVRELDRGSDEYNAYLAKSRDAMAGYDLGAVRFFDITIQDAEGNEVQPAVDVEVNISYADASEPGAEGYQIVHFGSDGTEILPVETQEDEEGAVTGFTHTQSGFSITAVVPYTTDYSSLGVDTHTEYTVTVRALLDGVWCDIGTINTTYCFTASSTHPAKSGVNRGGNTCLFVTEHQVRELLKYYLFPETSADLESFITGNSTASNGAYPTIFAHQTSGKFLTTDQWWADGNSFKLADGTWAFTMWTLQNACIYYVPGELKEGKVNYTSSPDSLIASDTAFARKNGLWSHPIKYYVYLNGKWELVMEREVWYHRQDNDSGMYGTDYLDSSYLREAFSPYGYHMASDEIDPRIFGYGVHGGTSYNIRNDHGINYFKHGRRFLSLTTHMNSCGNSCAGYNIYYLPGRNADASGFVSDYSATKAPQYAADMFWTVQAVDPKGLCRAAGKEFTASAELLFRGGIAGSIGPVGKENTFDLVVPKLSEDSAAGYGWTWADASFQPISDMSVTVTYTEGDKIYVKIPDSVTRQLYLVPTAGTTALPEGVTSANQAVHYMVFIDGAWQKVGTTNVVYKKDGMCPISNTNSAARWFVTSDQVYSILAPYGFDPAQIKDIYTDNTKANFFGHQTGGPTLNSGNEMWTDSSNTLIDADKNFWALGLSRNDGREHAFYYMPGYAGKANFSALPNNAAANASYMDGSRFYTVAVSDPSELVYSSDPFSRKPLLPEATVVREGGDVTYYTENTEGYIWTATRLPEVFTNEAGITTWGFQNVQETIRIVVTKQDPSFTVQYYAYLDRYQLSKTGGTIALIDTRNKVMPTNKALTGVAGVVGNGNAGGSVPEGFENANSQEKIYLTLQQTSIRNDQNTTFNGAADQDNFYQVATRQELTPLYESHSFNFLAYPSPANFDKLWGQRDYRIKQVWVLKDGQDPNSTDPNAWTIYNVDPTVNGETWKNIAFTNQGSDMGTKNGVTTILIHEGATLRLVYEQNPDSVTYTNDAYFHDYDVYDSTYSVGPPYDVACLGINLPDNYNDPNWTRGAYVRIKAGHAPYGFGNAFMHTGIAGVTWNNNAINTYNGRITATSKLSDTNFQYNVQTGNYVYYGCTFGMTKSSLGADGSLKFSDGIIAPTYLFGTTDTSNSPNKIKGKYTYQGKLTFSKKGDTYTLTGLDSTVGKRSNLHYLFHPKYPSSENVHTHIWTNNFWAVDNGTKQKDPKYGGSYIAQKGLWNSHNGTGNSTPATTSNYMHIGLSDDGQAHNWFFGMETALSFTVSQDYIGPLDYMFFGDDDLWVYLIYPDGSSRLIVDIGGVHTSVGEYVNLRDYIPVGSEGTYRLKFFYTERGGAGSTCWMSFTLPFAATVPTDVDVGDLRVSKTLQNSAGTAVTGDITRFNFSIKIVSPEGSVNNCGHTYLVTGGPAGNRAGTLYHDDVFFLYPGEVMTIKGLRVGSKCTITETSTGGYTTTVNGEPGTSATVTISKDQAENVFWTAQKPAGIEGIDYETRTVYRYRDALPEYSAWTVKSSGTVQYVKSWPAGFNTADKLFSDYNNTVPTASSGNLERTTVGAETLVGYIYWHWCAGYDNGNIAWFRTISDTPNVYDPTGNNFCDTWHAVFGTDAPVKYNDGNWYDDTYASRFNYSVCQDTECFFYLPVYQRSYTTETRTQNAVGSSWGPWSAWRETEYIPNSTRQVEKRTEYCVTNAEGVSFINTVAAELPSVGGTGTEIYYILGLGLTACAAWVLLRRRRADCQ